jgi:hypothetical protein
LAALALRMVLSRRAAFVATWGLKCVSYAVAAVVVVITLYAVHGLWLAEDYRAILAVAAREGCIVLRTNWLALWSNTGMAAGVLLLYVWTAYRMHRFERAAEARCRGQS